jgi:bifunctional non-homologous end joining protein LigD
MLATSGGPPPAGREWVLEPKYDGIRALSLADPRGAVLVSRNGNDKTAQFPDVAAALARVAARAGRLLVLDGEIVALTDGNPGRFQQLQGRIHGEHRNGAPAAGFVAFDLLHDGDDSLLSLPWSERRARLEQLLARPPAGVLLAETLRGSLASATERARRSGWEGLIAKRADSAYDPGRRSPAWRKIKVEHQQEFVVGGWTAPRNTRQHLGSLLVGYYEGDRFIYAGHVGTGFDVATLGDVHARLVRLERKTPPFETAPRVNTPARWTEPRMVVEVRFNEWTDEGKLRQPVFLGVRDDKRARDVVREPGPSGLPRSVTAIRERAGSAAAPAAGLVRQRRRTAAATLVRPVAPRKNLVAALDEIEDAGGSGTLTLGDSSLAVSNLGKVFFPVTGTTKGDLMRYYARIAPHLLPAIADRPLVLKRFPNGVRGSAFYQQRAQGAIPAGVRVEPVEGSEGAEPRFVGGDLPTLLHLVQLGAVSVDPWHARVGSLDCADYSIIDLDPGPKAPFRRVVEVAHAAIEELDRLGLRWVIKTSGARGLHLFVPLAAGTPDEAARLLAELVATRVAERHPKIATVVRAVARRPVGTVYVDYLQNIRGKTVASVYAVRARPTPTVSTPLMPEELTPDLDPREFTVDTVLARMHETGDLWARAMRRPNSLDGLGALPHA